MPRSVALALCIVGALLALMGALAPSLVLSLIDGNALIDQNLAQRVREPLELRCALLAFFGCAALLLASAQLELSVRAQIPATAAVLCAAFSWCWAVPHLTAAAAATDLVAARPVEKAMLVDTYRRVLLVSEVITAGCVLLALLVTLYLWSSAHRVPRIVASMTSVPSDRASAAVAATSTAASRA